MPVPGTGLYDWCKTKGIIKNDEDFYNNYIAKDWSLDQIPFNMTKLPNEDLQRFFKEANEDLSKFFLQKMSLDWVNHFGGNVEEFHNKINDKDFITNHVESNMNTHDVSGRS